MAAWQTTSNFSKMQNILIISRDAQKAATWSSLFKQRNYRAAHETSPSHALQTAQALTPALIILDLDLK